MVEFEVLLFHVQYGLLAIPFLVDDKMTVYMPNFTVDFPFNYLHNEIVRYFKERDVELIKEKEQWLKRIRKSDYSEIFTGDAGVMLRSKIFAQGNSETRLEAIGCRVGRVLVQKVSRDMPLLTSELDIVKFICKEFWIAAFTKSVDNLRTNHQGVYIIQDNLFHTVVALSDGTQYLKESLMYLAFPAGVVRGALENLGVKATVTAQIERLPAVKFHVKISK